MEYRRPIPIYNTTTYIISGKEYSLPIFGMQKRTFYKDFVFKAKGAKHAVVKTKTPVQIDPEVAASIDEFVDLFVTENRLEQIAGKTGDIDVKKTGQFLQAFNNDVIKESQAELEVSKLTWKDVSSAVSTKARNWYLEQTRKI